MAKLIDTDPLRAGSPRRTERRIIRAQAAYFLVTGVWPLIAYSSFERVTGPKVEAWLVKTFAALLVPVGLALFRGTRGRITAETRVLALGSAGALATCEGLYVGRGRIRRIYLLDAMLELTFLLGCLGTYLPRRRTSRPGLDGRNV